MQMSLLTCAPPNTWYEAVGLGFYATVTVNRSLRRGGRHAGLAPSKRGALDAPIGRPTPRQLPVWGGWLDVVALVVGAEEEVGVGAGGGRRCSDTGWVLRI